MRELMKTLNAIRIGSAGVLSPAPHLPTRVPLAKPLGLARLPGQTGQSFTTEP
jgi:hypothetical protein